MMLLTLMAVTALQAHAAAPSQTSPATAESVEILRRLLVESLDRAFERKESETRNNALTFRQDGFGTNGFVTALWAGADTVQHSRAFHVPDAGLFLALDAALPIVESAERPRDDAPEVAHEDEWERARRELRGDAAGSSGDAGTLYRRFRVKLSHPQHEIDPRAIDRLVDTVLETVARHGSRVEGLGQHDAITVAVRVTGRHREWLDHAAGEEPVELFAPDGEQALGRGDFSAYVLSTRHAEAKPVSVVVRVALADLAGAPPIDRLRQRARINRY